MVANRIRHSRKLRRHFKPDERWVYICTLAIASEAQPRGAFLTGGITPDAHDMADEAAVSVPVARRSLEKMREHGMLEQREDGAWHVHGFHEIQPKPKVDVHNARRQALFRNHELRTAVRERDGDTCRYCSETVDWTDRRSSKGGTYDHVDPAGPNSLENLVVACRGCNARKSNRTDLAPNPRDLDTELDPTQNGTRSDLLEEEVEGEVEVKTTASSGLRVADDPSTPDRPSIGGSA